uniref:Reticulon-4-interacting protein 1 homolog, mitochondrial n=1 Tax=Cacopsylla melanoneura TaxID=428564 RepID=A0A8D8TUU6_9HEMI
MDEVSFHLSQCLDSLQIIFSNLVHSGKLVLQNVREHTHVLLVQLQNCLPASYIQTFNTFLQSLLHGIYQLKQNINASFYFYRGPFVLADTFNRTNAISATLGLVFGTGIGLVIGLCMQYPCAPVSSMKAIGCMNLSGIEDITLDDTLVPCILYSDQILVKVYAGSIDAVDIRIASGYASTLRRLLTKHNHNAKTHVPVVLGRDCAGVVVEVGSAVSKFDIGDEVWSAVPSYCQGALAEFVVLKEDLVSKKPKTLSFEESVSLAYSGSLAWDVVFHKANLNTSNAESKKILIHCGSTGVGCILIQLCRLLDTHITVTCLSRAVQVMLGFGASYCIPLETPDLEEQLIKQRSRYDIVFNCRAGPDAHELCLQLCSKQGKVVTAVPPRLASDSMGFLLGMFYSVYVNVFYVLLGRTSWDHVHFSYSILDQISNLVDSGHIKPVVGNIFKPQDHQKAFHIVDSNQAIGKTVINFAR